jgi:hypothetical protein
MVLNKTQAFSLNGKEVIYKGNLFYTQGVYRFDAQNKMHLIISRGRIHPFTDISKLLFITKNENY